MLSDNKHYPLLEKLDDESMNQANGGRATPKHSPKMTTGTKTMQLCWQLPIWWRVDISLTKK